MKFLPQRQQTTERLHQSKPKFFVQVTAYLLIGSAAFGCGYWILGEANLASLNQQQSAQCEPSGQQLTISPSTSSTNKEVATLKQALAETQQKNQELMAALAAAKPTLATKESDVTSDTCAILSEKIELGLSQEAMKDLYSSNLAIKKKAFLALAQLQNLDARNLIIQLAENEQEDSDLRREVIRSMDWHGSVDQALRIFNTTNDESVKAAIILAAQDSQTDDIEKQIFEKTFTDIFDENKSEFIKTSILNYLSNTNKSLFDKLNDKTLNNNFL
jgi:hypothetical protein